MTSIDRCESLNRNKTCSVKATLALIETVKLAEAASEGGLVGLLLFRANLRSGLYTIPGYRGVALAGGLIVDQTVDQNTPVAGTKIKQ